MKIQSNWVIKYRKKCSKTYIYEGNFSNYFELPPNFVLQTCFTTDSRENQVICLDNSSFSERNGVSFKNWGANFAIILPHDDATLLSTYLYYGSLLWKKWVLWSLGHLPWAQEDLPSNICHILNSKREGYICFWGNIISKLAPQISDSLHHFCLWETEWVYKTKKKK